MARPILKFGDKGPAVGEWQRLLLRDGRDLGKARDDEDFGKATQNATIAWEWAHGQPRDGIVSEFDWQVMLTGVGADLSVPTERLFDLNTVPFVEAANWSRAVPPISKRLIVIHSMESAEASTTAEACARFFATQMVGASGSSAHYCVDADSVVCCVQSDRIAWHAPGANRDGIGIELAGYARQSDGEWKDAYSQAMLRLTAKLVRALARKHNIPIKLLDEADVFGGMARGITTHAIVSKAFGKSDHWDPGPHFPMADFLELVRG